MLTSYNIAFPLVLITTQNKGYQTKEKVVGFLQMQNIFCIFAIENRVSYEVVSSYMVCALYIV